MKRFMKISAITAVALIVVGFLIVVPTAGIVGTASISQLVDDVTDGRVNVKMDNIDDWGVFIGDKAVKLTGEKRYTIEDNLKFAKGVPILKGNVQKTYSGDGVDRLVVEAGGCEMKVVPSTDGDFHIEATGIQKLQGFVEDDTFTVKAMSNYSVGIGAEGVGVNSTIASIVLAVPEGRVFDSVEVNLGAGTLRFGSLSAREAEIEAGAGEIVFDGLLQADEADIKVGMGAISAEQIAVKKLDAQVGMGSLKLAGAIEEEGDLECSMGGIEMKLAGSEKDYNFNLEAAVGEVTVGGYSASGIAGSREIDNGASCDISLECSMGSIEITFDEQ